jgi:hypothetical protein
MATYTVKVGTTYETVTALQAAVTLVTGDIVQLDSSGGDITEPGDVITPATGITYTSLSGRSVWKICGLSAKSSTVIKNFNIVHLVNKSIQPASNPSAQTDVIIENNYMDARNAPHGCIWSSAFSDIWAINWKIQNNIIIGSSTGQIINMHPAYDRAYVYNNVLIANSSSYALTCSGKIKNNILVGNGTGTGIELVGATIDLDYNCVYNFSTPFNPPSSQGVHDITSNPQFVSSSDFHLLPLSPCLSGGIQHSIDSYVPLYDYDNNVRSNSDTAMGVYSKKPLSFFLESSVGDSTVVNSYLGLTELVRSIQAMGVDSYFDSEAKIGQVSVYYTHQDGREQKRVFFYPDHNASVSWSPLARDGTWQKTAIKVYDLEGAVTTISRAYIDPTVEDLTHSGGQIFLNKYL